MGTDVVVVLSRFTVLPLRCALAGVLLMGSSSGIILKNDLHSICFYLVFASKGEFARRPKMAHKKAEHATAETVHGKEPKKEGDPANKTAKDIASSTEKNGGENNGRKKAGSGEQQGKEAA